MKRHLLILQLPSLLLLLALLPRPGVAAPNPESNVVDVTKVWSGFPVGFAMVTAGNRQFVGYYDDNREMTLAQRDLGSTKWKFKKLPTAIKWDSHNFISMAVDRDNCLHISGNMHNVPLIYFRSTQPLDIDSVEPVAAMTGDNEERVTYPRFFRNAGGALLFSHRNGQSGSGSTFYKIYDEKSKTWSNLTSEPLFDGMEKMSAYPTGSPVLGPDGYFHVVWVWRNSPRAETNHDLSYVRSKDLTHWETAGGGPVTLPITIKTPDVIVDPVPVRGGLLNNVPKVGFDTAGKAVLSYYKYDAAGNTQLYFARFEKGAWKITQATEWDYRREFSGVGSLPPSEIKIDEVKTTDNGKLAIALSHIKYGSGLFEIDPDTWTLKGKLPVDDSPFPAGLRSARTPGMKVKWVVNRDPAGTVYILRWETLPDSNRDRELPQPWPQPTLLQVVEVAPGNVATNAK